MAHAISTAPAVAPQTFARTLALAIALTAAEAVAVIAVVALACVRTRTEDVTVCKGNTSSLVLLLGSLVRLCERA